MGIFLLKILSIINPEITKQMEMLPQLSTIVLRFPNQQTTVEVVAVTVKHHARDPAKFTVKHHARLTARGLAKLIAAPVKPAVVKSLNSD